MKSKGSLVVSICLNVILLGAVAYFAKNRSAPAESAAIASPNSIATTHADQKRAERVATVVTNQAAKLLDWRVVESEDYRKYIANLRAIGCPEETIRDIIVADVNKLFAARRRELSGNTNKFEFWKAGNPMAGMMDPDRIQKQQELAKEKRALLKELLGVEPEEKPDLFAGFNPFESMLDFLPPARQTEVLELMQKYQAKMMKGFSGGAPDADDMKQIQKTQRDMESDLATILSPQEFEDYQLRMSQTAMMMRMQLASFDPNEQEFREIFNVKKKFDDEFSPFGMGSLDKAEQEKMNAAKKEMEARLTTLLGRERYADYERSQDWTYQGIYRVAEKNGLPKDSAIKVYEMKKAAEDQANKVRLENTLTAEQRTAALQGIRTETENSIRTVFGDKAYQSYQRQANWLNGISPAPQPD